MDDKNFFTVQVRGTEETGYYVVITEGPFFDYEDAQEYAGGIMTDLEQEDSVDTTKVNYH